MAALNSLSHEVSSQVNERVFIQHPALPHAPSLAGGVCNLQKWPLNPETGSQS